MAAVGLELGSYKKDLGVTVDWCVTHSCTSESPTTRCYYAFLADSLDQCEIRDAVVTVTVED